MSKAIPSLVSLALFGVSAAAVTCSVYDSSLVEGSAATAGLEDASTTCEHTTFPPPSHGQQLGGDVDFTGALTFFDYGEQYNVVDEDNNYLSDSDGKPQIVAARPTGFDLDHLCTANPELNLPSLNEGPSCKPVANWFSPQSGDMPGGRDNGLRYVISAVASVYRGFGTQSYNREIQEGKVSLLMRVKDYNGEAEDGEVTVIVYVPTSFTDAGVNTEPPKFQGEDVWPIASESYNEGDEINPRLVGTGYVSHGILVGTFGDLDFRLRIGISPDDIVSMRVQLHRVFLTGRIFKDLRVNNHWALDQGQIAGRWLAQDLLTSPKYFPNPDRGAGQPVKVCMNASLYRFVRQYICQSADIPLEDGLPSAQCDAISVGIGFSGVEVKRGAKVDLPALDDQCGYEDPSADSCLHDFDQNLRADSGVPPVLQAVEKVVAQGAMRATAQRPEAQIAPNP